jgi:hypothetical protein
VCVCLGKTSTKTEEEKQHNNNKEGARSWSTKEETATGEAPTRRWCRLMQHSANRCHRCGFSKRTILASEESENVQQEEEVSETRTTHHRWCTDNTPHTRCTLKTIETQFRLISPERCQTCVVVHLGEFRFVLPRVHPCGACLPRRRGFCKKKHTHTHTHTHKTNNEKHRIHCKCGEKPPNEREIVPQLRAHMQTQRT